MPRPGTSEGRRLKCSASSVGAAAEERPSVADILRGVRDDDDDAPQWSDAIDRRTTATVSPDRVVATKHASIGRRRPVVEERVRRRRHDEGEDDMDPKVLRK